MTVLPTRVRGNTLKVRFVALIARHHYERNSRQCPRGLRRLPSFPSFKSATWLSKEWPMTKS